MRVSKITWTAFALTWALMCLLFSAPVKAERLNNENIGNSAGARQRINAEIGAFDFDAVTPDQESYHRKPLSKKSKPKPALLPAGPNDEDHFADREIDSVMTEQKQAEKSAAKKALEGASLEREFFSTAKKHRAKRTATHRPLEHKASSKHKPSLETKASR